MQDPVVGRERLEIGLETAWVEVERELEHVHHIVVLLDELS